jgi:hypothetical protein
LQHKIIFVFYLIYDLQITYLSLYLHPRTSSLKNEFSNKGLVAQLNSALDYGSRGYWFESSQGHKTPTDVGVFLCFLAKNALKLGS